MTNLAIGDTAPGFTLPSDSGADISLGDYAGKPVVLFFYPKDDTPGCTKEAIGFTQAMPNFSDLGIAVIGASKDPAAKHHKFVCKHELGIPLVSDENSDLCERYGVWVEKNMYGRKYMGIERATYLIGADGKIKQIWRKVKVPGHVEAVLNAALSL